MRPFLCIALVLVATPSVLSIIVPAGCSLNFGNFICDFRNSVPLNGQEFEPPPQRLTIEEIYGEFTGPDFFNFTNVNRTAFDLNYDAELELKCRHTNGVGGLLTLSNTSFYGMDFYQSVKIRDCDIEFLPASAFQYLVSVNFLGFQGGYLNVVNMNAFHHLTIRPDLMSLAPTGELSFIDVDIISGGFTPELLSPLSELAILTIQHSRFTNFLDDVFINLNQVHTLVLDDNPFTYIKYAVFRNMSALSKVSFVNIAWQCTCPNLWFLEDFSAKQVNFQSEVVCSDPPDWSGIRAENYWTQVCEEKKCDTGTMPSIDLGIVCLTYLQIAIYTMAAVGFCLILPTAIEWRRTSSRAAKLNGKGGIRMMTPRRPPPRQRAPMGHSMGFPAAKQAMYGNQGMAYPAGSFA